MKYRDNQNIGNYLALLGSEIVFIPSAFHDTNKDAI
jgi:hypothetical protein